MDYFFAACEELRHPELKDKSFVVGTNDNKTKMNGIVQTCSYPAREFGIKSGMPTKKAFELYKDLVYIKSDYIYYEKKSKEIINIIKQYHFPMEIMSIDECALDIGNIIYPKSIEIGKQIKADIKRNTCLPCTIGISTSKIYAKMVCNDAKPDGLELVEQENLYDFLKDKSVSKLPGIGPKTKSQLNSMGIDTISDLSNTNVMLLIENFGSFGKSMHSLSNCRDVTGVKTYSILSISREITLNTEPDEDSIKIALKGLVDSTITEVQKKNLLFKSITAKVKYLDFTDKIKTKSINYYTASKDILFNHTLNMITILIRDKKPRRIGVKVSSLINGAGQHKLF